MWVLGGNRGYVKESGMMLGMERVGGGKADGKETMPIIEKWKILYERDSMMKIVLSA